MTIYIFNDTAGKDYVAINLEVTIPSGQTNATFFLSVVQDGILENKNKTLALSLQGKGVVCVETADDVPMIIVDSDSK